MLVTTKTCGAVLYRTEPKLYSEGVTTIAGCADGAVVGTAVLETTVDVLGNGFVVLIGTDVVLIGTDVVLVNGFVVLIGTVVVFVVLTLAIVVSVVLIGTVSATVV